MQIIDITPGLSAWEHRRHKRRRRLIGYAIFATGLTGAALLAMPQAINPLVAAGIIAAARAPLEPNIPRIATAIPVHASDLPKQRPSLASPSFSAARDTDRTEAAFIARHSPNRLPAVIVEEPEPLDTSANLSGDGPQMNSLAEPSQPPSNRSNPEIVAPITATLPSSIPQATQQQLPKVAPKRSSGGTGPDEDFSELKKRAFSVER